MDSGTRPVVGDGRDGALSVQEALRGYMHEAPMPFAITRGAAHKLVYANASFCRLAGIADGDAFGDNIANAFTGRETGALSALLDHAFRDRVALRDERVDMSRTGGPGWRCTVWPVIDDQGRPEALGIELREADQLDAALDLQRQVAEQMLLGALREHGLAEDAEGARRRAAFLAEAGRLLVQSMDQASTLAALTKLALPTLGAWCIVDIVAGGEAAQRLLIVHPDPQKQKLADQLSARWTPEPDDPFGVPAMLRDRRTLVITGDIDAALVAAAHGEANLRVLRQLGVESLLTLPLVARGRLLGAVTFVGAERGRAHSPADVQLAEDLAVRGALALDNAQVHDQALMLKLSAETANSAKTAFLGAMSHELRTPLNAIGGYLELLDMGLRGPVTEEQHADLARMKTNQQYLLVLITEILNFVQVSSGRMSYAVSDVNAHDALARAVDLIEPLIAQRGISWEGITGDASIVTRADPEKVTQILVNLFSNAIKFTPAGGRIAADCDVKGDTVLLCISDTGGGIPADKLDAIFEPFVQLKEGLADRGTGVGLGLAISRDLARAMNGDLSAESSEGSGARFTLTLPRASEPNNG
ncbi:MAG TPA: GAF domain-containing sensor histidine kinase [Gemmatimonadaceae bacterium]|nr:GAF domain-containing sensor histidine kinase [Gemmatimonadaceae bacterium]